MNKQRCWGAQGLHAVHDQQGLLRTTPQNSDTRVRSVRTATRTFGHVPPGGVGVFRRVEQRVVAVRAFVVGSSLHVRTQSAVTGTTQGLSTSTCAGGAASRQRHERKPLPPSPNCRSRAMISVASSLPEPTLLRGQREPLAA